MDFENLEKISCPVENVSVSRHQDLPVNFITGDDSEQSVFRPLGLILLVPMPTTFKRCEILFKDQHL